MKKRNLLYGVLVLLVPVSIVFITKNTTPKEVVDSYSPRVDIAAKGYAGAIDYLNSMRNNKVTGKVDVADVLAARQQVLASANKRAAIGLQWEDVGPDNVGGRTRVILFDKDTPGKVFAAGVAGGLWVSTNSGSSWQMVEGIGDDLAIVSMTQAANGDLYYGTGENNFLLQRGIVLGSENGSSGFPGSGVWKSTDGGQTFTFLTSTTPNSSSTTGATWRSVSKLEADPNNANKIYAATNRGLQVTEDGGATWSQAISGTFGTQLSFDVEIASNGDIYATSGINRVWKSTDNGQNWTQLNIFGSGLPNTGIGRFEIAVAPSDPNYVYLSAANTSEQLAGVWRSTDAGNSWVQIGNRATQFTPFGTQGVYDQALTVLPTNKDKIVLGGVNLWTWSLTDGWQSVASTFGDQFSNPFYVHADKHTFTFDPNNPNHLYIGSDGGVGRSTNINNLNPTFHTLNINYSVTQFYAFDVNSKGNLIGGTQDNGTLVIDQQGNTPKTAFEVTGGDGAFCEFSDLDENVIFTSSQNAAMLRTSSFGVPGATFDFYLPTNANGGAFITPYILHETEFNEKSQDSITFTADTLFRNLGAQFNAVGGVTEINSQIFKLQESADLIPESFIIQVGPTGAAITKVGTGTTTSVDVTAPIDSFQVVGDFTGVFNSSTGEFYTELQSAIPADNDVFVKAAVEYAAGDVVILSSSTADYPIYVPLSAPIASGESRKFVDKVRANLYVGLNNQIWMCPNPLEFNERLEWYQISSIVGQPQSIEISRDGDMLLVGTSGGRVYRVTGLTDVHDTATALSNVTTDLIFNQGGQVITGFSINPNNKDQVIITQGNYGNSVYVRMSNNATSATPVFASKQGLGLPNIPVYDATFNQNNPAEVILGTDMGIWTTDNINAGAPSWTQESTGMGNVPVFVVKQQFTLTDGDSAGTIYAATHGRGFFKSGDARYQYIGVEEPSTEISRTDDESRIKLYPNPISTYTTVSFDLADKSDVTIEVRDIQGRLVKSIIKPGLNSGEHDIRVDLSQLRSGTYIMFVDGGTWGETSKFIVNK